MDIKKALANLKAKIRVFVSEHVLIIAACVILLVLFVISFNIRKSAIKKYDAVAEQLNDVENQITSDTITTEQQTEYVRKELVGGLDKNRWKQDDIIMGEWIYPAFTFNSADEYNKNRDIYVGRLGMADDFVVEVIPPYVPSYASSMDESFVDDGTHINMRIDGFRSYVDGFKDDVYSYVAVVDCTTTSSRGDSKQNKVILTYSITGDGEVVNFHAATPFTQD